MVESPGLSLPRTPTLTADDFVILAQPFAEETARLLPVPVPVTFLFRAAKQRQGPGRATAFPEALLQGTAVHVDGGRVFFALVIPGEGTIAVAMEMDLELVARLSRSWLEELQARLPEQLQRVKLAYQDPLTGLYNARALDLQFHQEADEDDRLLLLHAVFNRRSPQRNLQRVQRIAGHLNASCPGTLFYLGYGIFALLQAFATSAKAMGFFRALQRQCRRDGLARIQGVFCRLGGDKVGCTREALWQGLNRVQQRGPCGVMELGTTSAASEPFLPKDSTLVRRLQRSWRGLKGFSLLGVRVHDGRRTGKVGCELEGLLKQGELAAVGDGHLFVVLPDCRGAALQARLGTIAAALKRTHGDKSVTLAASSWPFMDTSKIDCLRNCMKVLLHCSFYGQGAVQELNALTMNVSGDHYFEMGDFRAAIREYTRGLLLDPSDINLLNSLGVALAQVDRNREAIATFEKVLLQRPGEYMALVNQGFARQAVGEQDEALECFEKALTVKLHSAIGGTELFLPLCRIYSRKGRWERVSQILGRWREEGSTDEYLYHRLFAQSSCEQGQLDEGMQAAQKALTLNPVDDVSMSLLGLLYVLGGQGEEVGLSLCQRATEMRGGNADNWYRFARALATVGKSDEARQAVRRCRQLNRRHEAVSLLEAQLLAENGKKKRAVSILKKLAQMPLERADVREQAERMRAAVEENQGT